MIIDAIAFAKKCHACQIQTDYIHQPLEYLHPMVVSWPFDAWGINVVGYISPPSSKGHRYILAITNYFSKWSEATTLKEVKALDMVKFIKHHVITGLACHKG